MTHSTVRVLVAAAPLRLPSRYNEAKGRRDCFRNNYDGEETPAFPGFPNKRLVASGQEDSGATVPSETGRGKVIRTLDPRFPKPVLYQAELYPEFRFDPLPERGQKGKADTALDHPYD